MELHLTPEQEARLTEIAVRNGTIPERLVTNAVLRLLEGEAAPGVAQSELPSLHLGPMGSLHRREIYEDVL